MILSEVRGIQTKSTDPAFVDRPSDLERNSLSQLCRRQPLRPLRLFFVVSALKSDSRRCRIHNPGRENRSDSSRTLLYTIPLRNSSSGYFVPRHVTPSSRRVRNIERSNV